MKLTVQSVVVVLNTHTKFTNTQGGRHEMTSTPPSVSFQHHVFHEMRTPMVNKHARLVLIGLPQIWKLTKLSQVEKRIQQTS